MILEVDGESLRGIAAAVAAAMKRPEAPTELGQIEAKVLKAIGQKLEALELDSAEAQALQDALTKRAWDQRRTIAGDDYADLAERISRALEDEVPPLEETTEER